MSTPLFFRTPLDGTQPVELLFGDPAIELGNPNVIVSATMPAPIFSADIQKRITVEILATMPAPVVSAMIARPVFLEISATMPAPAVSCLMLYDNAVTRGPRSITGTNWQQADKQINGARVTMDQGTPTAPVTLSPWGGAVSRRVQASAAHRDSLRSPIAARAAWREGVARRSQATAEHKDTLKHARTRTETRFSEAEKLPERIASDRWIDLFRHARPRRVSPWGNGVAARMDHSSDWQAGKPHKLYLGDDWTEASKPKPGFYFIPITPPIIDDGCYDPPPGNQVGLLFDEAFTGSPHLVFYCRGEEPSATVVVPVRRAYIVINDVHLRRVSNSLELPCFSLNLSLDADSWTWGFSASLPASSFADVEPSGFGDPVELDAEINGLHYRLLVEKISKDRAFGSSKISISGRGKSAVLADPYSPMIAHANIIDRTAQQLMGDVLTTNGAPIGWSVEWNVTDWLVPAGVFSHQGSYMSAVNAIAGAIGAYIQPHPTSNTLRVLNRYPTAPWDWAGVTPDFELPAAAMSKEGIEWLDLPEYNAVYVSGTSSGIIAQVKRTGSAGDLVAPMITDPLITRTEAARQRGIATLGNTGRIATVTLELPVLPETGIIEPGKFVRYLDGATTRNGIVRGVSVSAQMPSVRQSIEVECHG